YYRPAAFLEATYRGESRSPAPESCEDHAPAPPPDTLCSVLAARQSIRCLAPDQDRSASWTSSRLRMLQGPMAGIASRTIRSLRAYSDIRSARYSSARWHSQRESC